MPCAQPISSSFRLNIKSTQEVLTIFVLTYGSKKIKLCQCLQSTYCSTIVKHAADDRKTINVVNLDPAAEYFDYEPLVDIRELIHLDDAMDDADLKFGPNGGLVFCME